MDTRMMLNVLWEVGRLRRRERWTREMLEAHQAAQLRRLREFAYERSPFYHEFHRGLQDAPLSELPVLTKSLLMERFDTLVTDPRIRLAGVQAHAAALRGDERFLERYRVNATSGSSGQRGYFLFSSREWATVIAGFARGHEWAGFKVDLKHRMKMASVASTSPWHMSARIGATVDSRWMPALRLDAGAPLASIVEQLNAWQPEMLVAYPSMGRLLAREQAAGRLRIAPDLVWTGSELLTEETRQRMEAAWSRPLFNEYGATECGLLAAEGQLHNGLYLSEDLVIVEVVDRENRPVSPGTYGDKLLLTVLFNDTQPLIRYELSDRVRLAPGYDASGRPYRRLDGIEGRAEDVLHFPAVNGGRVDVHPVLFHGLLDMVPASAWQVVQEPDALVLLLSGADAAFDAQFLAEQLCQKLRAQGALVPPVSVRRVEAIPRNAAGKAPLIRTTAVPRVIPPLAPAR